MERTVGSLLSLPPACGTQSVPAPAFSRRPSQPFGAGGGRASLSGGQSLFECANLSSAGSTMTVTQHRSTQHRTPQWISGVETLPSLPAGKRSTDRWLRDSLPQGPAAGIRDVVHSAGMVSSPTMVNVHEAVRVMTRGVPSGIMHAALGPAAGPPGSSSPTSPSISGPRSHQTLTTMTAVTTNVSGVGLHPMISGSLRLDRMDGYSSVPTVQQHAGAHPGIPSHSSLQPHPVPRPGLQQTPPGGQLPSGIQGPPTVPETSSLANKVDGRREERRREERRLSSMGSDHQRYLDAAAYREPPYRETSFADTTQSGSPTSISPISQSRRHSTTGHMSPSRGGTVHAGMPPHSNEQVAGEQKRLYEQRLLYEEKLYERLHEERQQLGGRQHAEEGQLVGERRHVTEMQHVEEQNSVYSSEPRPVDGWFEATPGERPEFMTAPGRVMTPSRSCSETPFHSLAYARAIESSRQEPPAYSVLQEPGVELDSLPFQQFSPAELPSSPSKASESSPHTGMWQSESMTTAACKEDTQDGSDMEVLSRQPSGAESPSPQPGMQIPSGMQSPLECPSPVLLQREGPDQLAVTCPAQIENADASVQSIVNVVDKFGPVVRGNKREVLRNLAPDLDLALLVRLEPDIYVALQCDSHDSKAVLKQRAGAFVQAHGLNPVVANGLVKKCLIMMRKKDTLSEKKMLGTVRLKSTALLQYCVVDIISLF